jgi:hypothetical protein
MSREKQDRELGMRRYIMRRDFLNGVEVGIGVLGYASLPELTSKDEIVGRNSLLSNFSTRDSG